MASTTKPNTEPPTFAALERTLPPPHRPTEYFQTSPTTSHYLSHLNALAKLLRHQQEEFFQRCIAGVTPEKQLYTGLVDDTKAMLEKVEGWLDEMKKLHWSRRLGGGLVVAHCYRWPEKEEGEK